MVCCFGFVADLCGSITVCYFGFVADSGWFMVSVVVLAVYSFWVCGES